MPHNHEPKQVEAATEIGAVIAAAKKLIREKVVRWLRDRAAHLHDQSVHEDPLVARRLIEEANALTRAASDLEQGIGWLE